jgi:hypothetical protein
MQPVKAYTFRVYHVMPIRIPVSHNEQVPSLAETVLYPTSQEIARMGIIIAYSILALLFLSLATGIFKPKTWQDLPKRYTTFLRFGCFFGFLVIVFNVVRRLL